MKKIILKGSFIVLFLFYLMRLAYAIELPNINKSKIRLQLAPGKAEYGEIIVENQSPESRSMRVYLSDWDYLPAADGTKEFFPISTTALSCASWISFSPAEFTLQPFGKQKINYTVKVPENAQGGYYAALFFESIFSREEAGKGEMRVGMNLAIRIATLFYVDVEGKVKRTALIENLSFKKDTSGQSAYTIGLDFTNTGNVDITSGTTFHIMNADDLVIARGIFNDTFTFPNSRAKLSAAIKDSLPQGKYNLVLTVDIGRALEEADIGRGPIITKEAEISIGDEGKVLNIGQLQ